MWSRAFHIFHSQDTDSDQQSCLRNSVVDQVDIEEWQLVSMVGESPDKEVVSPVDTVDNSRVSTSMESETYAA